MKKTKDPLIGAKLELTIKTVNIAADGTMKLTFKEVPGMMVFKGVWLKSIGMHND